MKIALQAQVSLRPNKTSIKINTLCLQAEPKPSYSMVDPFEERDRLKRLFEQTEQPSSVHYQPVSNGVKSVENDARLERQYNRRHARFEQCSEVIFAYFTHPQHNLTLFNEQAEPKFVDISPKPIFRKGRMVEILVEDSSDSEPEIELPATIEAVYFDLGPKMWAEAARVENPPVIQRLKLPDELRLAPGKNWPIGTM